MAVKIKRPRVTKLRDDGLSPDLGEAHDIARNFMKKLKPLAWDIAARRKDEAAWNYGPREREFIELMIEGAVLNLAAHVVAARGKRQAIERRIKLIEERGTLEYLGVHKTGETYSKGAVVTRAGSLWIARRKTGAMPGNDPAAWTLAVKRGRDARGKPRKDKPATSAEPTA